MSLREKKLNNNILKVECLNKAKPKGNKNKNNNKLSNKEIDKLIKEFLNKSKFNYVDNNKYIDNGFIGYI